MSVFQYNELPPGYRPDVAIFLSDLGGGGAERVCVMMANAMAQKGLKVDLVLSMVAGPYLKDVSTKIRIVALNDRRVIKLIPKMISYFSHARPKTALSTLYRHNFMVILSKTLSRSPTRIVLREANTFSKEIEHQTSGVVSRIKAKADVALLKKLYPKADAIIAISKGVADDLAIVTGIDRHTIRVVYNPLSIAEVQAQSEERIEHPFFEEEGVPVLLAVGRLENQKDYPTLLRGFALACRERDMRLIILGEGSQRKHLMDLSKELGLLSKLSMLGFADNPFKYMARASTMILSSAWEGFGNVLIEAMAVGTPVISSDCPSGPAEIMQNGRYGHLFEVGDAKGLARAILSTLDEPVASTILKSRAEDFSSEKILLDYLAALNL